MTTLELIEREQVEKGMKCCEEFLCGECPYEQYDDKINHEFTIRCMHKLMVDINKLYFKEQKNDN